MIRLLSFIEQKAEDFFSIRRQLHQIPELGYEERETSSFIRKKLTEYGYESLEILAKTGIVAILDTGKPGKTLAFRADIDALPINEETGLSYQSKNTGKMHACGHDGHTATLLALAWLLQQEPVKSALSGKIKLIFQPAEEGGKGSLKMIKEGVLENPQVDAIFGYHNWPGLPEGVIAARSGPILAGSGRFEVAIHGQLGHMAMRKEGVNAITTGARMVSQIDQMCDELDPKCAVLNILSFNGGSREKGMSAHSDIMGVYYVESADILEEIKQKVVKICEEIAQTHGATVDVSFKQFHPPTVNSHNETQLVLDNARLLYGGGGVRELSSCMMVAEDFSEYLQRVPGCFFLVGAGENAPSVHTSQFDFNDRIIPIVAALFAQLAIEQT